MVSIWPRSALPNWPNSACASSASIAKNHAHFWAPSGVTDKRFVTSLIVLPVVLIFLGILEKRVDILFASMHKFGRTLLVSMLAAVVIESALALAVTLISNPGDPEFARHWWMAFSRSLPMGVLIGLFMGFYMKPRMDRMRSAAQA